MRSEHEVEQFRAAMLEKYDGIEDSPVAYEVQCYEAGIPRTFWAVQSKDVVRNNEVFKEVIEPYRKRHLKALRNGYSLFLLGDNGSGKTMFACYLLTQAIKRGQSAYYTTLAQMDIDIKSGFRDRATEERLTALLESDFVVIDECGKETHKIDSYTTMRFELFLKQRYDDGEPVILISNIDHEAFVKMYGSSVESMLEGRYRTVTLDPGDFRKVMKRKMKSDMGYD